jgi:hypothetical protein
MQGMTVADGEAWTCSQMFPGAKCESLENLWVDPLAQEPGRGMVAAAEHECGFKGRRGRGRGSRRGGGGRLGPRTCAKKPLRRYTRRPLEEAPVFIPDHLSDRVVSGAGVSVNVRCPRPAWHPLYLWRCGPKGPATIYHRVVERNDSAACALHTRQLLPALDTTTALAACAWLSVPYIPVSLCAPKTSCSAAGC